MVFYPDKGCNDFDYVLVIHGHYSLHNQHRYLQERDVQELGAQT
jgi:hypothetical protein